MELAGEGVGEGAGEVDQVEAVVVVVAGAQAAAEEAGADDADVGLGAAVAAGAAVAVVAEDEPEGLRVGGGGGVEAVEEAVAPRGGGGVGEGVAAVGVAGLVDAQDVDEGEAGGRGDGGEGGGGEALGAPLRQAVPRGVVDRLGAVKAEAVDDLGVRLGDGDAVDLRREGALRGLGEPADVILDARLLLGAAGPQDVLDGQGDGREADVDLHGLAAGAQLAEVREPVGVGAREAVEEDDAHAGGGVEAGAAGLARPHGDVVGHGAVDEELADEGATTGAEGEGGEQEREEEGAAEHERAGEEGHPRRG